MRAGSNVDINENKRFVPYATRIKNQVIATLSYLYTLFKEWLNYENDFRDSYNMKEVEFGFLLDTIYQR